MINVAVALIESAARSLDLASTHPIEARRAVSASYYAVYHALAKAFADALIGEDAETRPKNAWLEVYRGLDHSACLTACDLAVSRKVKFPDTLMNVAGEFGQLQRRRHAADYDPREGVDADQAGIWLNTAKDCVDAIEKTPKKDILAFATWVLITTKGAKDTRASAYPADPARQARHVTYPQKTKNKKRRSH